MDEATSNVDRRSFLKTGVAATAGAVAMAAHGKAHAVGATNIKATGTIPTRRFGKTGIDMPMLGHGGSAMIERDAPLYGVGLLPKDERIAMVRSGFDKGIRYFDTARIYQDSEEVMGLALKDVRDQVFIATKAMVFKPEDVRKSVEGSLAALGVDSVDTMQIHGPVWERNRYDGTMPIYEELVKLRDEGMFKYIGLTGHSAFEEMYKGIATGGFDTLLIESGYVRKGFNTQHSNTSYEWRELCKAKAAELDMGIIAMKVLSANVYGHNAVNIDPESSEDERSKLPGAAIRYVLSDPRICVLNIGVSMPSDIDKNIALLNGDTKYSAEDRVMLAKFAEKAYQYPIIAEMPVV